ncbi:MAG: DUF4919 domain-containing protein [Bacteroidetes bacterium]|nr:MAG: DUF4919 domain-containing protein [Bacteroidota bacterium]TAG92331.1 MAG: DUF4919 domain-containing protein [Bacteroidota bacterium]
MHYLSKNYFFYFFILIFFQNIHLHSQTVQGVSYDLIKQMTQEKNGVYEYNTLLKRFQNADTTLLEMDCLMLYYGSVYQKNYHPYKHITWEDSLGRLTDAKNAPKALQMMDKILEENPVSLTAHIEGAYTFHAIGRKKESTQHLYQYNRLLYTIMTSGMGNSYENSIILISPKDAEVVLMSNQLSIVSKSINGQNDKYYLVYLVKNREKKEYPIYFDITLAYTIGMEKVKNK